MDKAFSFGEREGKEWGHNLNRFLSAAQHGDADLPPYYDDPEDIGALAFESGFKGLDKPIFVTAFRIGEIPKSGRSTDFREQQSEPGVSVLNVEGEKEGHAGTFEMFNPGNKIKVAGWLHYKTGSDGEPLLLAARKIEEVKSNPHGVKYFGVKDGKNTTVFQANGKTEYVGSFSEKGLRSWVRSHNVRVK